MLADAYTQLDLALMRMITFNQSGAWHFYWHRFSLNSNLITLQYRNSGDGFVKHQARCIELGIIFFSRYSRNPRLYCNRYLFPVSVSIQKFLSYALPLSSAFPISRSVIKYDSPLCNIVYHKTHPYFFVCKIHNAKNSNLFSPFMRNERSWHIYYICRISIIF